MFRGFDIIVRFDEESFDTGLNVLTNITSLCEGVTVAYRERDVDLLAQGPSAVSRMVSRGREGVLTPEYTSFQLPSGLSKAYCSCQS